MGDFGFQWHLSDRCNLRCAHCYQGSSRAGAELGPAGRLELAERLLGALAPERVSVNLTGGEPFLLEDLVPLLAHLHGHACLDQVWLITNGTLAGPGPIEQLAAFERLAGFKLSLESCSAEVNDAIRGPGHLARVRAGLPAFLGTGKPVVLMLTLGRHNLGSLEASLAFARAEGLSGVIVERFVPLGRGRGMARACLDRVGWRAALSIVARAAGAGLGPEELCAYSAFWLAFDGASGPVELRGAGCDLGPGSMALMPDGAVLPCRRLPLPVGNLAREPFEAIRERLRAFAPRRIRARLAGPRCAGCPVGGCAGCRALALALSGSELSDDPLCPRA